MDRRTPRRPWPPQSNSVRAASPADHASVRRLHATIRGCRRRQLILVAVTCLLLAMASITRLHNLSTHIVPAGGDEAEIEREAEFEPKGMRIVIAGPPASGKGTQCENIVIEYDVVHLSTGDMLREAVASGSEVGVKAKELMESGQLVDDEVIIGVVEERLASPEIEDRGFLLDGFPRTPAQAEALDDAGVEVDTFILLNVPDEVLIDRVTGRRLDPVTGEIYHMTTKPPPAGEIADRVTQRADDTPEKLGDRLKSYHANLGSIKDFYSDRLVEIDGNQAPDDVWVDIRRVLNDLKDAAR